ncbi:hypothetical protein [Sediminispirochaeta smaragdinae]|uniref:hypothetical protein n=1 Tax=Sediminispirochaeta smaragdinae TaxID=55206 RepID=UPI0014946641|nr:hypothetical protein [Sediminispirochaeta smaragdinae]
MPELCNLTPVKNCNFIPVLTPDYTVAEKLEEQAEQYKETNLEEISENLLGNLKDRKSDKAAKMTTLLNQLYKFVDQGGHIETYEKEESDDIQEDDSDGTKQIENDIDLKHHIFNEIRRLQYDIDELKYLTEPEREK